MESAKANEDQSSETKLNTGKLYLCMSYGGWKKNIIISRNAIKGFKTFLCTGILFC